MFKSLVFLIITSGLWSCSNLVDCDKSEHIEHKIFTIRNTKIYLPKDPVKNVDTIDMNTIWESYSASLDTNYMFSLNLFIPINKDSAKVCIDIPECLEKTYNTMVQAAALNSNSEIISINVGGYDNHKYKIITMRTPSGNIALFRIIPNIDRFIMPLVVYNPDYVSVEEIDYFFNSLIISK